MAQGIGLNSTTKSVLATASQVDTYTLTVVSPSIGNFKFTTGNSYSAYEFNLSIFDSTNQLVGGNWIEYQQSLADFNVALTTPGIYTVRVTSGGVNAFSTDPYTLTLTPVIAFVGSYESELNNTRASADVLALGGSIKGQLSNGQDVDCYQVNLPASGDLSINVGLPIYDRGSFNFSAPTFKVTPCSSSVGRSCGYLYGTYSPARLHQRAPT